MFTVNIKNNDWLYSLHFDVPYSEELSWSHWSNMNNNSLYNRFFLQLSQCIQTWNIQVLLCSSFQCRAFTFWLRLYKEKFFKFQSRSTHFVFKYLMKKWLTGIEPSLADLKMDLSRNCSVYSHFEEYFTSVRREELAQWRFVKNDINL